MCGIICAIRLAQDSKLPPDEAIHLQSKLDAGLEILQHRGPDARGTWTTDDGRVGLAHCRLAINDLTPSAAQPLHSPCGRVHAVVNGEIYGFESLRDSLIFDFGYHFQSQSDSEVALALYMCYGEDFYQHLRGEFAICIYDERTNLFIAVRDRYGIKPLFWTVDCGVLLVAAEAKAFLAFDWQPKWDVASIVEGGWNFDERTLFHGVRKLRPGYSMTCSATGSIVHRPFWDIQFPNKRKREQRSVDDLVAGVREHLLDSIRLRLRADVPLGIYLSGGIDSSVVAGMVAHLAREKGGRVGSANPSERVCCFSIAFDKTSGFNESDIAERTAKWLGVRYLKKVMDETELANRFEDATWHCEHHNHDLNHVGKFALSELPREYGFKVVLTGEGADEVFAGYSMYRPDYFRELDLAMNDEASSNSDQQYLLEREELLTADFYRSIGATNSSNKQSKALDEVNNISTPRWMSSFQFDAFASWANTGPDVRQTIVNGLSKESRERIRDQWHPLHAALYAWTKGHLANNFLSCLGDRTEMAHSIEARPPFLDHVLTGYVNALPPSLKLRYDPETDTFVEKWILREAARPFVTDEIYTRRKHAYTAPSTWPPHGPLHRLFQRLICETSVRKLGFVDWERVRHSVTDAFEGGDVKSMRRCYIVGQWIVLSTRLKIPRASPES